MKDKLTVSSSKISPPRGDIRVEFTGKNLTKFGGIQLVRKFLRQLRVKEEIEGAVLIEKRGADSGFYDGEFLDYLEMKKIVYAIVVKLYDSDEQAGVGHHNEYAPEAPICRFRIPGFRWNL